MHEFTGTEKVLSMIYLKFKGISAAFLAYFWPFLFSDYTFMRFWAKFDLNLQAIKQDFKLNEGYPEIEKS